MHNGVWSINASGLILEANTRDECDDIYPLAYILNHRCSSPDAPYPMALGLEMEELRQIVVRWFPAVADKWNPETCLAGFLAETAGGHHRCPDRWIIDVNLRHGHFNRTLLRREEAALCQLFLDHRADDSLWPPLFARLIARACMEPDHLWMCLGLLSRHQLTGILERRFTALARKNSTNMRWKKFFSTLLNEAEGVNPHPLSSCRTCSEHDGCFTSET